MHEQEKHLSFPSLQLASALLAVLKLGEPAGISV